MTSKSTLQVYCLYCKQENDVVLSCVKNTTIHYCQTKKNGQLEPILKTNLDPKGLIERADGTSIG
jgi:hypothetical protein